MPDPVSLSDQWESATRELRLRQYVYPKRVATGAMTQRQADHELACMAAIVDTLRALLEAARDDRQARLFPGPPDRSPL